MLVIRTNDGNNRAWTIGAPRPAFTVPELHSIIHVNVFGPELDCLRLRFEGLPFPKSGEGAAVYFGDMAKFIVANL